MQTQGNLHPMYFEKIKDEAKIVSKFSLIDLAGSERISDKEKNSERIEEAKFINKSLSALGNVVAALRTSKAPAPGGRDRLLSQHNTSMTVASPNRPRNSTNYKEPASASGTKGKNTNKHIPYRDSKLTHILKDSLGSNSFTHLIITLSPSYLCLPETISTLAFTKNAKAVKQNVVENVTFK
jgi:hypothetical protein